MKGNDKTPKETAKPEIGSLVPQPNGKGALRYGGTNKGGPGVPTSAIRERCRGSFAARIPVLEKIADGQWDASNRDRVKAMDVLAKYGGVDKLALTVEELPETQMTPERITAMWESLQRIKTVEQFEKLLVAATKKQLEE